MKLNRLKTKYGDYEVIDTDDGYQTLKSPLYNENCHSTSGAYEETKHNYFIGCQVPDKFNKSDISILEIGLGVGLGVLCTHNESIKVNSNHKINFVTTEIDHELALWVCENGPLKNLIKNLKTSNEKIEAELSDRFKLTILLGDARRTVPLLELKFDCIFMDAFSPTKNPSLWTYQWFRNLRSLCNNETIMTTYSASIKIRKAMLKAGFHPTNMPGFGAKKTATRAFSCPSNKDAQVEKELLNSKTLAFSDEDLESTKTCR